MLNKVRVQPFAVQMWEKRGILAVAGLAIFGIAWFWINTPWGIGVNYDSYFYLSAADNFLAGNGFGR